MNRHTYSELLALVGIALFAILLYYVMTRF